ncbi:hypothetical protein AA105894_0027 [Asaia spathodeae NBRC 105894]|nr:hypothetical protein AA105894_0027 [Asaia spathodeae NBRC 105894]
MRPHLSFPSEKQGLSPWQIIIRLSRASGLSEWRRPLFACGAGYLLHSRSKGITLRRILRRRRARLLNPPSVPTLRPQRAMD